MTFIKQVGVELEGAWKTPFECTSCQENQTCPHVIGPDQSVGGFTPATPHFGEIASPPNTLQSTLEWMEKHYPNAVNQTCGFHVHVSFKSNLYYSRLVNQKFYQWFLEEARKWGEKMRFPAGHLFWERLEGRGRFALPEYRGDIQVFNRTKQDGNRYTALNYCYAIHGTIECRLFPGFEDYKTAKCAVEWLCQTYDTYLKKFKKESRKTILIQEGPAPKNLGKIIRIPA